ncbi:GerW family sporulation protein [Butyricicoccus porcorum]|uniref:Sporulation protein YtfJ n=1 Tax=Butyricicoccus porcorum TaxID=1945634 RepID=A0A252F5B2_9FIRM|nr:GerW family sporulation protein [Butyricicoccus porcorum]MCI6926026.1 GerW family sporulation protein [Butyricicoccus porcorum]MDD6987385.1 GerW family sporulation protein [Butyricicoccus porcorum]MDY4484436.1 GerW family sporulation protein [Butyricicoccus porcorum]OUM20946.1 sporulation protein YtfJ [Butyricicoccus porcorum]
MAEHAVNGLMAETMEKIRSMVDVNTIIGDPIVTQDGTTLIPISKVTFGFGSGGSDFKSRNSSDNAPLCFGGGGGAGVSITPIAFLIVNGGDARILPVNMPAENSTDRLIEMIPGAINGIQNFVSGRRGKQDESDSSAPVQTGETAPTAE